MLHKRAASLALVVLIAGCGFDPSLLTARLGSGVIRPVRVEEIVPSVPTPVAGANAPQPKPIYRATFEFDPQITQAMLLGEKQFTGDQFKWLEFYAGTEQVSIRFVSATVDPASGKMTMIIEADIRLNGLRLRNTLAPGSGSRASSTSVTIGDTTVGGGDGPGNGGDGPIIIGDTGGDGPIIVGPGPDPSPSAPADGPTPPAVDVPSPAASVDVPSPGPSAPVDEPVASPSAPLVEPTVSPSVPGDDPSPSPSSSVRPGDYGPPPPPALTTTMDVHALAGSKEPLAGGRMKLWFTYTSANTGTVRIAGGGDNYVEVRKVGNGTVTIVPAGATEFLPGTHTKAFFIEIAENYEARWVLKNPNQSDGQPWSAGPWFKN